jgi:hypothetical protein
MNEEELLNLYKQDERDREKYKSFKDAEERTAFSKELKLRYTKRKKLVADIMLKIKRPNQAQSFYAASIYIHSKKITDPDKEYVYLQMLRRAYNNNLHYTQRQLEKLCVKLEKRLQHLLLLQPNVPKEQMVKQLPDLKRQGLSPLLSPDLAVINKKKRDYANDLPVPKPVHCERCGNNHPRGLCEGPKYNMKGKTT